MKDNKPELLQKVTLFSGKTVTLREIKVRHQEQAAMLAAPKSNGNNQILTMIMQKELLKLLIVAVDDQPVKSIQLEDMDSLFSFKEVAQLYHVLNQIAGSDDLGKFQIEHVSSGGK
jgi:hypothetical protein